MKQYEFTKLKQQQWKLFEQVVTSVELAKKHDLPKMLRQLSHDFSIAKSRHYSPALINHLNQLLLFGQQQLYKPTNRFFSPLLHFIKNTFPQQLSHFRFYIIWAHVLFYGVALLAFAITVAEPDFIRNVLPNMKVIELEEMYDPSDHRFTQERPSDNDFVMFGYYIFNNISISFQSFVGGLLLGFGALYILLFNALYFGVVSAHIVNVGYSQTFFSFVITHGAFELTAIVLSAAAGFVLAVKLIMPGKLSRLESVKRSANKVFNIIFGAFLMLVIAAFIEAFWSSSHTLPNELKYAVGIFCWVSVLLYIFRRVPNAD
ncbi:MAG: putative membrane protein SpoIIM required for sporulation [Paraglaciecola sp.]|jgi:uncharacterized membrane protein SpoIIM required for sporulation